MMYKIVWEAGHAVRPLSGACCRMIGNGGEACVRRLLGEMAAARAEARGRIYATSLTAVMPPSCCGYNGRAEIATRHGLRTTMSIEWRAKAMSATRRAEGGQVAQFDERIEPGTMRRIE